MKALLERVPESLRGFVRMALWVALAWLAHEALAWLLVELGLVARLLAPTPSAATFGVLAVAAVFFLLRLGLVFVAPPVLVASFVRAIAALLASGDDPPAAAESARVAPPRGARAPRPVVPPGG